MPEPGDGPIPLRTAVNLDSVESVSVAVLVARLGRLADVRMREICGALAVDCQGSVPLALVAAGDATDNAMAESFGGH